MNDLARISHKLSTAAADAGWGLRIVSVVFCPFAKQARWTACIEK
jgi:hypothetical protein